MITYATQFTWKVHKLEVGQKYNKKIEKISVNVIKTPPKFSHDHTLSYFISYCNLQLTTPFKPILEQTLCSVQTL